jgi:hypothetical protein
VGSLQRYYHRYIPLLSTECGVGKDSGVNAAPDGCWCWYARIFTRLQYVGGGGGLCVCRCVCLCASLFCSISYCSSIPLSENLQ